MQPGRNIHRGFPKSGHLSCAVTMVGASGFEPLTPSASRKCSPPELRAFENRA